MGSVSLCAVCSCVCRSTSLVLKFRMCPEYLSRSYVDRHTGLSIFKGEFVRGREADIARQCVMLMQHDAFKARVSHVIVFIDT